MTNVWGMLFAVLEFCSAVIFFDTLMERRNKKPIVIILFILSSIVVYKFILSYLASNRYFYVALMPFYFFIATLIIYDANFSQKAFASIYIVALFYSMDGFVIILMYFLQINISKNILGFFTKIFIFFVLLFTKNILYNKKRTLNLALKEWTILLLIPSSIMCFYGLTLYKNYDLRNGNYTVNSHSIISLLVIVCMLLLQAFVFLKSKQKNDIEQKSCLRLEQQIKMQMESVMALADFNHSQRKLTHEFKNQMICISELIQNQKYDEVCRFVNTTIQFLDKGTLIIQTKVPVINAIISH